MKRDYWFEILLPIVLIVMITSLVFGFHQHMETMKKAGAEFTTACAEAGGKAVFNGRHMECIK